MTTITLDLRKGRWRCRSDNKAIPKWLQDVPAGVAEDVPMLVVKQKVEACNPGCLVVFGAGE